MSAIAWSSGGKGRVLEVSVFLVLVVPPMMISLLANQRGGYDFVLTITQSVLRNLALLSLVLFLLWRNGEGPGRIGWTLGKAPEEVVLGMLLCLPAAYGTALLEKLLVNAGLYAPAAGLPDVLRAENLAEFVLVGIAVAVVAVAEETVFRGYLLLRLRGVLGAAGAVMLSSVVFALGHGYQGSAGMVSVGALGVVYAVVYLWRGSLVAPMVMHFMQNLIAMVLLPLIRG
jgi:membrane protease YdiL (CAAX protease family)